MAIGDLQAVPRRGITLSPLGLVLLSVMLTAAVVLGALVGRWTAPSTTAAPRARILAPGSGANADPAGFTSRQGWSTGVGAFVPGVTDFPSSGSLRRADRFVPWVTDFPS